METADGGSIGKMHFRIAVLKGAVTPPCPVDGVQIKMINETLGEKQNSVAGV